MGRVSELDDTSVAGRVRAVQQEYAAKQNRFFILFAIIEGGLLALLGVLIYGVEVIDPDVGLWILLGVAAVGGFTMMALLMRLLTQRNAAVDQARGVTPLT